MSTLPHPPGTGSGQIGEGANIDTSPIPGTSDGMLLAPGEELSSAALNRGAYAVNENVAHIWARMKDTDHPLAVTMEDSFSSSGDSGATLTEDAYVGQSSTSSPADVMKVIDPSTGEVLQVGGTDVYITDIKDTSGGVSVFKDPSMFYMTPWVDFSQTIPPGTSYIVRYGKKSDLDELEVDAILRLESGGGGGSTPPPASDIKKYSTIYDGIVGSSYGDTFLVPTQQNAPLDLSMPAWSVSIAMGGFTAFDRIKSNGKVVLVLDTSSSTVYAFSAKDGSSLWSYTSSNAATSIDLDEDYAYVGIHTSSASQDSVEVVNLQTGAYQTTFSNGMVATDSKASFTDLACVGGVLYGVMERSATSDYGIVFAWDVSSGMVIFHQQLNYKYVYYRLISDGATFTAICSNGSTTYIDKYSTHLAGSVSSIIHTSAYNTSFDIRGLWEDQWGKVYISHGSTGPGNVVVHDNSYGLTHLSRMLSGGPGEGNSLGFWHLQSGHVYWEKGPSNFGLIAGAGISNAQEILGVDEQHLYVIVGSSSPYSLNALILPQTHTLFRRTDPFDAISRHGRQLAVPVGTF